MIIFCMTQRGDETKIPKERKRLIDLFKRENYVPYIHYIQNVDARADLESQVIPFINDFSKELGHLNNNICIEFYKEDGGHNAMPTKEKTIRYIIDDLKHQLELKVVENEGKEDSFLSRVNKGEQCERKKRKANKWRTYLSCLKQTTF